MSTPFFHSTFERGFGTFPLRGEALHRALQVAIQVGYRSIDTAQMYNNEADVGELLHSVDVPRESLCITTKVHPSHFNEAAFLSSVEESLKKLRLDQVDVLLLHWPPVGGEVDVSLKLLESALERGLTKHIGVSNYTVAMMKRARNLLTAPLVCNQVEFHPLLDQSALLKASVETGIPLSSYCSVARGEVMKHSVVTEMGERYGKSAAQITLRWILQKGVSINAMSTKPENIQANFSVMDFTLSSVDMAKMDRLGQTGFRIVTKDMAPWAPQWD